MQGQTFQRLRDVPFGELHQSIVAGTLEMKLGPFTTQISSYAKELTHFLYDTYRDVPVRTMLGDVTDLIIRVRAPNRLRRYIRPQLIPDPGFQVPAVPLPTSMAALAFEMGVNLSVALKCCRFLMLHAGVVANDKGGIIMCADSGSGKSTLTAALMEKNYRLFSDEFGIVGLDQPCLHAYPRPVSLKNESINVVRNMAGPDWISPTLKNTPKGSIAYRRPRPEDIALSDKTAPVKLVFFPVFTQGERASARRMAKSETMMKLISSSINYHLLGKPGFDALCHIVSGADAYELRYGNTNDSVLMAQDLAAKAGL